MNSAMEAVETLKDPVKSAEAVGLRYVTDATPGIARERSGKGFRFKDSKGRVVADETTLKRIRSLVIPPAWKDVWICSDPNGHLQATGRDERGRKQFRYHSRWREIRDETKYARMVLFAKALPSMRQRVERDLSLPGLPREKVLATIVRLLETSLIRVGNDEYARNNDSFGLTTMRDRHVEVNGSKVQFRFRGKSGKWHNLDVRDKCLATIVKRCQDLPGQELFQFLDEQGVQRDVRSDDVNSYLREISGQDFTAKDFRTWAGTVLAAMALTELRKCDTKAQMKKNLVAAVESVASRLGNTPAVCRKCYIHPQIFDAYLDGTLLRTLKRRAQKELSSSARLRPEETSVLRLLERRLSLEEKLGAALKRETRRTKRAGSPTKRRRQGSIRFQARPRSHRPAIPVALGPERKRSGLKQFSKRSSK
jgi:Topoisomerase IB